MRTRFMLRGVGVLAFAFVLTSAVMFWLPFLERSASYDFYHDYIDTYTPRRGGYSYDYSYDIYDYSVRDLKKRSSIEEARLLDAISPELKEKTNTELFQMRAYPDVCVHNLVDCRGLESTKVKPFIDAILSDRQAAETALYSRAANFISAGSLFVSFVALIFTGLTYRRNRARKDA